EEVGGGRIVGEACHAIDLCSAVTGSAPIRVYAESAAKVGGADTTDDRVFITMRHENGSISSISYQAGGDRAGPQERVEVFGGGRSAVLDEWSRLDFWKDGGHTKEDIGKSKGHSAELAAFSKACRDGVWPVPWEEVRAVTWASLMAVQSL